MKRYDKYKPSGIDWIGDIPEHWTVATVGRVTNLGRGRVISNLEIGENPGDYPVYSSQTENNGVMGHLATYDFDGEYVTWTTDGANAGTVFHRTGKFNCTNVCGTIQPKNWEQLDLRFLPYYLNLGTKYSVRLDINPKLMNNMMAKIPLVIPDKPEQKAIADYLTAKIEEIDMLIKNKQKSIELFKEERLSVINELVNPKQNNWENKKLKYLSFLRDEIIETSDFKIAVENIESGSGRLVGMDVEKNYEGQLSAFKKGDTIFNKLRPYLHKVYFAERDGGIYGELLVLATLGELTPEFLYFKLFSKEFINVVDGSTQGTKMPRANWNDFISQLFITYPKSKDLQNEIVENIKTNLNRIELSISKSMQEIELLSEYRMSLIYETVTGKIKVI